MGIPVGLLPLVVQIASYPITHFSPSTPHSNYKLEIPLQHKTLESRSNSLDLLLTTRPPRDDQPFLSHFWSA